MSQPFAGASPPRRTTLLFPMTVRDFPGADTLSWILFCTPRIAKDPSMVSHRGTVEGMGRRYCPADAASPLGPQKAVSVWWRVPER